MTYKIFSFFNKIGDCFPIGGGAAGAVSQYREMVYNGDQKVGLHINVLKVNLVFQIYK